MAQLNRRFCTLKERETTLCRAKIRFFELKPNSLRPIDKFENTKKMASILILKFGFLQVKMKRTDAHS